MTRFFLALIAVAGIGVTSLPANNLGDEDVARLVKQLGDDSFEVRESAEKRLIAIGKPARRWLDEAIKSDDLEVCMRAQKVLALLKATLEAADVIDDLKDRSVEKRLRAVRTIAEKSLKSDAILRELRVLVNDKNETLNEEAAFALALLGEKDIKHDKVKKANCDGKYSTLLRRIEVPADRQAYQDFRDFGTYQACDYGGHQGIPQGYWVWVAPHWHIWHNCK